MRTHQTIGHPSDAAVVRDITARIAEALSDAKTTIQFADYQESIKVDGVNGGERMLTGNRTIVIEIGAGDKDVEIVYSPSDCCGG